MHGLHAASDSPCCARSPLSLRAADGDPPETRLPARSERSERCSSGEGARREAAPSAPDSEPRPPAAPSTHTASTMLSMEEERGRPAAEGSLLQANTASVAPPLE